MVSGSLPSTAASCPGPLSRYCQARLLARGLGRRQSPRRNASRGTFMAPGDSVSLAYQRDPYGRSLSLGPLGVQAIAGRGMKLGFSPMSHHTFVPTQSAGAGPRSSYIVMQ